MWMDMLRLLRVRLLRQANRLAKRKLISTVGLVSSLVYENLSRYYEHFHVRYRYKVDLWADAQLSFAYR